MLRQVRARWADCVVVMPAGTANEDIAVAESETVLADHKVNSPGGFDERIGFALPETLAVRTHEQMSAESDRQRALLVAALEATVNTVIIMDRELGVTWVNPAFSSLFGYSSLEIVGQHLTTLAPKESAPALLDDMTAALRAGRVWSGETLDRRKDGALLTTETTITPVRDRTGAISHLVGIKQDVTERKQLERRFLQAQKMEAMGTLASGVAHDFNNVLGVICLLGAAMVRALPAGSPMHAKANQILETTQRGANLTRQLLAFTRQQVLDPRVVDLNHLVSGMNKMLARLLGEDVELTTVLTDSPAPVVVDAGQFEHVLVNLAVNARDAMPQGGKLTVTTAKVELGAQQLNGLTIPAGQYVRLAVSDTGCGMDCETQTRAFEPFFTTKPSGRGTGLGLSTVYGIVRQSGGHVHLQSEVGVGTTVETYLPCVVDAPEAEVGSAVVPGAQRGSGTLLVVDDQQEFRAAICDTLSEYGYDTIDARDGLEALDVAGRHPGAIWLLLTDVVMPRMSGPELAQRLREARPEMRVLFMSGYPDAAISRHGLDATSVSFIQKPFAPDALVRKMQETLDRQPGQS
jgi:PAS domain S-box-containing protein